MTDPQTLPDYSADYGARTAARTDPKSLLVMDLEELIAYLENPTKK